MILDKQTRLADAQALTASAASTNYYDCGGDFDIGRGEPLCALISVGVAADSTTGDETYAFAIRTDDNTGFSSATTLVSQTIAAASLTAGSRHILVLGNQNERYIDVYATLGGTTPSVTVDIDILPLSMARQDADVVFYPSGYTIS